MNNYQRIKSIHYLLDDNPGEAEREAKEIYTSICVEKDAEIASLKKEIESLKRPGVTMVTNQSVATIRLYNEEVKSE